MRRAYFARFLAPGVSCKNVRAPMGRRSGKRQSCTPQEKFMETPFEPAPGQADENRTVSEIKNLIADVEDLVARIANLKDEDVARLRTQGHACGECAKEGLAGSTDTMRRSGATGDERRR